MGKNRSFSILTTLGCEVTKINLQSMLKGCSVIILIVLLSGCAMSQKERLANSSTNYNLVVEKAQNEMLLLNIVRASKRHPMYFTALSQIRGSMEYNFQTGSISIPFGKIGAGLDGAYSVAPSISYSNKPSFDLAVLDNEKFIRGIMCPVPLDTVYYYWQQGWPQEMLMLLLFERIEPSDKPLEDLDNDPGDKTKFEKFQKEVHDIQDKCKFILDETPELFGPTLSTETAKDMNLLIEAQKAGLIISAIYENDKIKGYQFKKAKKNYYIQCPDKEKSYKFSNDSTSSKNVIYLRSPEAILYYLGEIVRTQTDPKLNKVKLKGCDKPNLFVVDNSTGAEGKNYSIAVDYEEIKYGIPKYFTADSDNKCPDRSMQVLSLISQLIGLQKSVEQMPVTGTVNVIGR